MGWPEPPFPGFSLPIYAVGMTAPGLPGGRDGLDLDSCQGCQLWPYLLPLTQAPGGCWNSGEAHRNQAKRRGARQEGGGSEI